MEVNLFEGITLIVVTTGIVVYFVRDSASRKEATSLLKSQNEKITEKIEELKKHHEEEHKEIGRTLQELRDIIIAIRTKIVNGVK